MPREVIQATLDQIQEAIQHASTSGRSALRLRLKPEGMGTLDIRLSLSPDGLVVQINADREPVRNLLASHLDGLQTALREHGVRVDQVLINSSGDWGGLSTTWQSWTQGRRQQGGDSALLSRRGSGRSGVGSRVESVITSIDEKHAVDYRV